MNPDRLLSTINKKGGIAESHRFNVIFTPPDTSLLNLNLEEVITSAVSGSFDAKNLVNDPRDITLLCRSVNMPGRQIQTLEFQAHKKMIKIPNGIINDDVNMSFLLTNDYYVKKMFENWMHNIFNVEDYYANYIDDYAVDVIIQQLDKNDIPVYGVKLKKAFPITMESIPFDNNNENAVNVLNIGWSYENYESQGSLTSAASGLSNQLGSIFG